ncbi:hypothetical protein CQA49_05580 [Helicobacter sp. MIT 00-7814]|uniref:hypothetical protein n=1 Tax=unclassified Helicobacter TaxID=2593540 RepID=UPI000E1F792D|nr:MULTISPECIES: hypothetical protein [unclassified Helicobacter]RDU53695.1 hypothetical protein CQA37_06725 [Helicobacter sp. MIT 99-10781]RDU54081.1 hypothetical protein CQA49_05580 [Helicobacter sp. MIT 00-7814]
MKPKNIVFAFLSVIFAFSGCAKLSVRAVESPSIKQSFFNGVEVLESKKSASYVRFEVAQKTIGGASDEPLVIFITASVLDSQSAIFDLSSITASQNGKLVEILSYEDAKNSNLNFSQAIESFGIFTPQNPYASGIAPSMPTYPMLIYRGYPGFFIYDPWYFSARDRIEQNMRLEENRRVKSIILSSYLRKNTLEKGQNPRGGFIAINQHKLKKGTLTLQVKILSDIHTLEIELSK